MKILFNSPFESIPGGVSTYCQSVKPFFNKNIEYYYTGRVSIKINFIHRLYYSILSYIKFLFIVNKFDIVHLNTSLQPYAFFRDCIFLLIAKFYKKKVVVFIHGWNESFEYILKIFFPIFLRLTYFKADAVIVLSNNFQNKFRSFGYAKTIFVETTTVKNDFFLYSGNNYYKEFNFKSDINILFLSRIEKSKGVYKSIDTFCILKSKYSNLRLTIVGDGTELLAVQEYVAQLGIQDVYFTGHLAGSSLNDCFSSAHIYFFPTEYGEGMPISLLEAMSHGIPIVTRPVGGILDFFEDGRMGFFTESKEIFVFSELLSRLIDCPDMCFSMGKYNFYYSRDHFHPKIIAKKLENIYDFISR